MAPPPRDDKFIDGINCPLYREHAVFLEKYAGQELLTRTEVDEVVRKTVKETLLSLGIDAADPIEMQRDFQTLRDWRRASGSIRAKGTMTLIGILTAGLLGVIWIGVKSVLTKS
jgi:hypothetical protein